MGNLGTIAAFGLLIAATTVAMVMLTTPIVDRVSFTVVHECAPVQGAGFAIWK